MSLYSQAAVARGCWNLGRSRGPLGMRCTIRHSGEGKGKGEGEGEGERGMTQSQYLCELRVHRLIVHVSLGVLRIGVTEANWA